MDEFLRQSDCETVIKNCIKTDHFKIKSIKLEPLVNNNGMMAEYFHLLVQVEVENQEYVKRFFCKRLVMFHKIQEVMGKQQGAFEKEDYIYNFLIKECQKISGCDANYAPECYLSIKDKMFVLEDLALEEYRVERNLNLDMCKLTMETFAQFHASTIIYEETQSKLKGTKFSLYDSDWKIFQDSLFREDENYLGRKWFKNCVQAVLKVMDTVPRNEFDPKILKKKFNEQVAKVYDAVKPSTTHRNVVCHGDTANVNILFKFDDNNKPIKCKLIDFQALRYNPPTQDILNFLFLNTTYEFRKIYKNALLEYYHKSLEKELCRCNIDINDHITLEDLYKSCEYVLPHAIVQSANFHTMIPMAKFRHIEKDSVLYEKYVYEDRSFECVTDYKNNGLFKQTIDNVFKELYEI